MVAFDYQVNGKGYRRQQSVANASGLESEAKSVLSHYLPGMELAVHYRPENPNFAFVETQVEPTNHTFLISGLSALATGLIFTPMGIRLLMRKRALERQRKATQRQALKWTDPTSTKQ